MITNMDKTSIIQLKEKGLSNCAVARQLGIHRKTVAKYWEQHEEIQRQLSREKDPIKLLELQELCTEAPTYDSSSRKRKVITDAFYRDLNDIIQAEIRKEQLLHTKKQNLTRKQIHWEMQRRGHKVGYSTLCREINHLKGLNKECFIRQIYDFGDRLEFDFGEVHLYIEGAARKYYIAVFSSPASNFRWCYLYDNQKQSVFLDAHVRLFDMTKGVWKEVVYDNMKNVVAKFFYKNGKVINEELLKLSKYYGFSINTTNAYKGNEKGHVENSVKTLRNLIFAERVEFSSIKDAQNYMNSRLIQINMESKIDEELLALKPAPPKYEIAKLITNKVDKYSFIQIENNKYSVPEYLIGYKVTSKIYHDKILIYCNNEFVCKHARLKGKNNYSVDIRHYLKTFMKKPGAIRNSIALKSNKDLCTLFNKYYSNRPKEFINIIYNNKNLSLKLIIKILTEQAKQTIFNYQDFSIKHNVPKPHYLNNKTSKMIAMYNDITLGGLNYGY